MNIAKNRTIAHPNPVEMAQNVSVLVTLISATAHLVSLGPVVRTTRTNANKNLANMGNVITLMEVTRKYPYLKLTIHKSTTLHQTS